ncbi:phosphoglucomutase/phosphomannomutase family protein [Elusimicrobiota bacterium]
MIETKRIIKFGTDGWRARMAGDFTFQNVRKVAWALSQYLTETNYKGSVLVGFDRRFYSNAFAREAAGTLSALGIETYLSSHVLPTPALSYLAKQKRSYAVVVTASHNPPIDNGIKIKTPDGASAGKDITNRIEQIILRAPDDIEVKQIPTEPRLKSEYMTYLKEIAKPLRRKASKIKIIIDYFHGSSLGLLEQVLDAKIIALRDKPDPYFGGTSPEPVEKNLDELKKTVRQKKALIGIAIDGDGDRIAMIDDQGRYITPTIVFPMYAYYHALIAKEPGEIVQGVSLGYLAQRIASKANLPFKWVPVGFKHIAQRMLDANVLMGGEESGGYALGRLVPDRDGIVNTLLILNILLKTGLTPSKLIAKIFKDFGKSCFERYDFRLARPLDDASTFLRTCEDGLVKRINTEHPAVKNKLTIDGLKLFFEDGSWLLIRPSGTEPLVRIYAETPSQTETRKLLSTAADWIKGASL